MRESDRVKTKTKKEKAWQIVRKRGRKSCTDKQGKQRGKETD